MFDSRGFTLWIENQSIKLQKHFAAFSGTVRPCPFCILLCCVSLFQKSNLETSSGEIAEFYRHTGDSHIPQAVRLREKGYHIQRDAVGVSTLLRP